MYFLPKLKKQNKSYLKAKYQTRFTAKFGDAQIINAFFKGRYFFLVNNISYDNSKMNKN